MGDRVLPINFVYTRSAGSIHNFNIFIREFFFDEEEDFLATQLDYRKFGSLGDE
jgi:hypothetical protein